MDPRIVCVSILCVVCYACSGASPATDVQPQPDTNMALMDLASNDVQSVAEDTENAEERLSVVDFGAECSILPDCSPLLGPLQDGEAEPGVNCIERRLYWWLGAAKSIYLAAAVIDIGDEVLEKELQLTDDWDTEFLPVHPGFLTGSAIETVIYGDLPDEPLISCYAYGTSKLDGLTFCSSGHVETWYVHKGRALAFFGDDCVLKSYDESCASIYRLYPIQNNMVIDHDGSEFPLDEAMALITDGTDDWSDDETIIGHSICPYGLKVLSE